MGDDLFFDIVGFLSKLLVFVFVVFCFVFNVRFIIL